MTETFLLDSWAVLAYLKQEAPADSRVIALLEQAAQGTARLFISIINLGEVYYSVGRLRGEGFARQVLAELQLLPLEILPADEAAVFAAARWKMRYPLSYADAFAAAAAEQHQATLLTGDPELLSLAGTFKIEALHRG
ncbi:MAG: type II toxin-antitoxin system VapC family toxin [Chloroflexota bacterium]